MKNHTYLISFLILTVLIASSAFASYFLYGKIQSTLSNQERAKLEQEIQQQQIDNLPELAHRYQKISESEEYFKFVYSEDKVVEIIKDIERIAREEDIVLVITQKEVIKKKGAKQETASDEKSEEATDEKKPKELVDTLPYEKSIRLELKAESKYLAIRNFLHKLETAPYALDVLAISGALAPVDEDAPAPKVVQNDSPFLLQGTASSDETPRAPTQDKTIFVIETALYTQ